MFHIFIWGVLGALFGGTKPTKSPHGDGTGTAPYHPGRRVTKNSH